MSFFRILLNLLSKKYGFDKIILNSHIETTRDCLSTTLTPVMIGQPIQIPRISHLCKNLIPHFMRC